MRIASLGAHIASSPLQLVVTAFPTTVSTLDCRTDAYPPHHVPVTMTAACTIHVKDALVCEAREGETGGAIRTLTLFFFLLWHPLSDVWWLSTNRHRLPTNRHRGEGRWGMIRKHVQRGYGDHPKVGQEGPRDLCGREPPVPSLIGPDVVRAGHCIAP